MKYLVQWWEKPKPLAWVAWCDYCGAAGLYAIYLIYQHGSRSWETSVSEAVVWPVHLAKIALSAIGGAA